MKSLLHLLIALSAFCILPACGNDEPADKVEDAVEDAADAAEDAVEEAGDAVEDATDGH